MTRTELASVDPVKVPPITDLRREWLVGTLHQEMPDYTIVRRADLEGWDVERKFYTYEFAVRHELPWHEQPDDE